MFKVPELCDIARVAPVTNNGNGNPLPIRPIRPLVLMFAVFGLAPLVGTSLLWTSCCPKPFGQVPGMDRFGDSTIE